MDDPIWKKVGDLLAFYIFFYFAFLEKILNWYHYILDVWMYDIYLIFSSNIAYYYDYNVLILQVEDQLIQSSVIKSTKKSCTAKEKVPSSVTRPSSSRKLNHSADPIQSETVERSSFGSRSKWLVDSMKLETLVCVSKSNRMHVFWEFQRLRLTTHKLGRSV